MEPSSSPPDTGALSLSAAEREVLLDLADQSIRDGLGGHGPLQPDLDALAAPVQRLAAAFVTVTVGGELVGCVGAVEPVERLGLAVPRLAWAAAFDDPRLPSLRPEEEPQRAVKVSVLGPLEPLDASTPEAVLAALEPRRHGLLLQAAGRRATFLPEVWETLPDPRAFLTRLLAKAGLSPSRWPSDARAWRYTTEVFGRGPSGP